jgi:hypothetical protein
LIDQLNKKYESDNFVLLPLEDDKKPYHADIITVNGKDVLRIPKSDFVAYEKQCQVGQIMYSNVAPHSKNAKLETYLPKKPWKHIERKYKLKKAVEESQKRANAIKNPP